MEGPINTNRSSVTTFQVLAALFLMVLVFRDVSLCHWVRLYGRFEGWLLASPSKVWGPGTGSPKMRTSPSSETSGRESFSDTASHAGRTEPSFASTRSDTWNAVSCPNTSVKLRGGSCLTPVISAPFSTSIDFSNVVNLYVFNTASTNPLEFYLPA
jgi:hypothetical protein